MLTSAPVRLKTITFLTHSQPPMAKSFIRDRLQRNGLAAAELAVGSNQHDSAGVVHTITQRLGREAAENDGVSCTDTGTSLHGDNMPSTVIGM
jgi:hypothetical protein